MTVEKSIWKIGKTWNHFPVWIFVPRVLHGPWALFVLKILSEHSEPIGLGFDPISVENKNLQSEKWLKIVWLFRSKTKLEKATFRAQTKSAAVIWKVRVKADGHLLTSVFEKFEPSLRFWVRFTTRKVGNICQSGICYSEHVTQHMFLIRILFFFIFGNICTFCLLELTSFDLLEFWPLMNDPLFRIHVGERKKLFIYKVGYLLKKQKLVTK